MSLKDHGLFCEMVVSKGMMTSLLSEKINLKSRRFGITVSSFWDTGNLWRITKISSPLAILTTGGLPTLSMH